jgi:transcriptional regulator with XRE-family HTH domain
LVSRPTSSQSDLPPEAQEVLARIREIMALLGISQQRLAKELYITKSQCWRYINGEIAMTLDMIRRFTGALRKALEADMREHPNDEDGLEELRRLHEESKELVDRWIRAQIPRDEPPPSVPPKGVSPEPLSVDRLADVVDELAAVVGRQWIWEAGKRRLRLPAPIPVRWKWSAGLTSKIDVVTDGTPRQAPLFPAIPGVSAATPASLEAGELRDLFEVYAGLTSGRLVILGDRGSGKSAAGILMLLDALEHRRGLDDIQRAKVPVPVLLTAHGWDPRHQRLAEWLVVRLAEDYPFLRQVHGGRSAAEELVEAGRVTLLLDGFDEIAPKLQQEALEAIRRQTTLRLVVLTRSAEFAAAVSASRHIDAAAVLELSAVSADDAATYLESCLTDPLPPAWHQLVTHLREHPDSVLTQALDSPLTMTLLRDAFQDPADIRELLVPDRFDSRDTVEEYLLDRSVEIAYRQSSPDSSAPSPNEAKTALSHIAARMNEMNTRDLAWWRMHHWASPIPRILTTTALGLLAGALIGALAFGPLGQYTVRGHTGTAFGATYLAAMGAVFGLMAGLVSEFRGRQHSRAGRLGWFARRLGRVNGAVGLLLGLAVTMAVGNQSNYIFGPVAGLAAGLVAGRAATRMHPDLGWARRSRWAVMRSRLDTAAGTVAGLSIGLTYGLTKGPTHGLVAGIVSLATFGLIVGFARPSADARTATDPGASWRRDREHAITFGLTASVALGIPLGLKNGLAHGVISGVVAGVCFGLIVGLGCAIGASDTWRTTLLFLQLRGLGIPLNGVRFLEDARQRGLLRTVGPLYQFRHPSLQDRLAKTHDGDPVRHATHGPRAGHHDGGAIDGTDRPVEGNLNPDQGHSDGP